ncbi:hypothetical protein HK098_006466, partial [Nowakowskiella sp. JEL0407]
MSNPSTICQASHSPRGKWKTDCLCSLALALPFQAHAHSAPLGTRYNNVSYNPVQRDDNDPSLVLSFEELDDVELANVDFRSTPVGEFGNQKLRSLEKVGSDADVAVDDDELLKWRKSVAEGLYSVPSFVASAVDIKYQNMTIKQFTPYYATVFTVVNLLVLILSGKWSLYGQHVYIWSMKFTRFLSLILPTVFFIPIVEILIAAVKCTGNISYDPTKEVLSMSSYLCFEYPRSVFFGISVVLLCLFIPISLLLNGAFIDINPTCKTPMHRVSGKVSFYYVLLKTVRSGIYFGTLLVGVTAYICLFFPDSETSIGPFITMASVFIPGVLLGAWITSYMAQRTESICRKLEEKMQPNNSAEDSNLAETFVFKYPHQVEMTARFIAKKLGGRKTKFLASEVPELRRIFKRGVQEFPENAIVRISYAAYMLHLGKDKNEALKIIAKTAPLNLTLEEHFLVGSIIRIANQAENFAQLGFDGTLDFATFTEYKKIAESAQKNFSNAIAVILDFWKNLHQGHCNPVEIETIAILLYKHTTKADKDFNMLLTRFPMS